MRIIALFKLLIRLILLISFVNIASLLFAAELKVNNTAPKITLRDVNNKLIFGKNILKEKPILAGFFFTNCVPSKEEISELELLNKKYSSKIRMFLIATDKEGADAVIPYLEKMKIINYVLFDKYSATAKYFRVTQYPSLFIIGRDGKVPYLIRKTMFRT